MLQSLRHEKILEKLNQHHAVKVAELAEQMNISESTIRRDINELDRMGRLRKVFGGAVPIEKDMTLRRTDVSERSRINVEEKESVARYAASIIEDNDFVYIDAGTTTEMMIDFLENKNVTYVTNGVIHAGKLLRRGFTVHMIGGVVLPITEAAIGPDAVEAIRRYNFTKCFMGTNCIHLKKGFSTPDINEAAVKRAAIQSSRQSFVLADHEKFGRIASVTFADLNEAIIITDRAEDCRYEQETVIKEVEQHTY